MTLSMEAVRAVTGLGLVCGFRQMGKKLLTKGTASAVPKKIAQLRASAPEVRFFPIVRHAQFL